MKQGIEPERSLWVRMVDVSISLKKRFPAAGVLMGTCRATAISHDAFHIGSLLECGENGRQPIAAEAMSQLGDGRKGVSSRRASEQV
jgi:hypothetical protein